jgi:hypothetical protein
MNQVTKALAVAIVVLLSGHARLAGQTSDTQATRVVTDAAAALGGRERILAVRTFTIEGYASNPNIGQAMTPEAEPLWWMIPDFSRRIDLEHQRMELAMTSMKPGFARWYPGSTPSLLTR